MNELELKKLAKHLTGEAMDEGVSSGVCNCGVDHGDKDKNIAPSVVTGEEKPEDGEIVSSQDAANEYLAMCQDGFENGPKNETLAEHREHCDAAPGNCPFERAVEKGEGEEARQMAKTVSSMESSHSDWKGKSPILIRDDNIDSYELEADINKRIEGAKTSTISIESGDMDGGNFTFRVGCLEEDAGTRYNKDEDRWEEVSAIYPLDDPEEKIDEDVSSINKALEGTGVKAVYDKRLTETSRILRIGKGLDESKAAIRKGSYNIIVDDPDAYEAYKNKFMMSSNN